MTLESLLNGDRDKFYAVPYKNQLLDKDGCLTLFYRPWGWPFDNNPVIAVYDRMDNGEWRLTETVKDSFHVVIDGTVYYYFDGRYGRHDTFYNGTLIPLYNRGNAPENVYRVYEEVIE